MSNYPINGDNPNHEIQVGWDPMLNTYFVHIIDTTKEEDDESRDVVKCYCQCRRVIGVASTSCST